MKIEVRAIRSTHAKGPVAVMHVDASDVNAKILYA